MSSYRSLLVHLDSGARCAARVELAIALALEHRAHLLGVAACGWPPDPLSLGIDLLGFGPLVLADDSRRDAARTACEAFADRARARGLDSFTARVEEAAGARYLVELARCHDLTVAGQHDPARGGDPIVPPDLAVQLLLGAGRPLLLVPWAGRFERPPRTVLAAWSGTRESARALADALPLLSHASAVHLIGLQRPHDDEGGAALRLESAQQWLARHAVEAQVLHETVDIDFGDALLSRAADLGAELIVMGGYGHPRAAEFVLGGMTRKLLTGMTVPVLVSH
jgi:nucleotide-binding universal stress UspA family protein